MRFDFSKLRGRIVEKFGTAAAFADAMGRSKAWVSARLSNGVHWSSDEIAQACDLLGLAAEDIPDYFYVPEFRFSELSPEED